MEDQKGMMIDIALAFYKDLFKKEDKLKIPLSHDFWEQDERVLVSENDLLISPLSENEIKDVVWSCYAKGALGPDGLSFMFYHKFWDLFFFETWSFIHSLGAKLQSAVSASNT